MTEIFAEGDGDYQVTVREGKIVWKKPMRSPGNPKEEEVWVENRGRPSDKGERDRRPVKQRLGPVTHPRFRGMSRSQIRRAQRRYAWEQRQNHLVQERAKSKESSKEYREVKGKPSGGEQQERKEPCQNKEQETKLRLLRRKERVEAHPEKDKFESSDRTKGESRKEEGDSMKPTDGQGMAIKSKERGNESMKIDDLVDLTANELTAVEDEPMGDDIEFGAVEGDWGDLEDMDFESFDIDLERAEEEERKMKQGRKGKQRDIGGSSMCMIDICSINQDDVELADGEGEEPWATLALPENSEVKKAKRPDIRFPPIADHEETHLRPLYIQARVNGKPVNKVFVDNGAIFNIMPLATYRRLGFTVSELGKSDVVMSGFTGQTAEPLGLMVANVEVGPKVVPSVFFVMEETGNYSLILGRDWIHSAECVPSTLHQCLMFWDNEEVICVEASPKLLIGENVIEKMLYSEFVTPISKTAIVKSYPWQSCRMSTMGYTFYA